MAENFPTRDDEGDEPSVEETPSIDDVDDGDASPEAPLFDEVTGVSLGTPAPSLEDFIGLLEPIEARLQGLEQLVRASAADSAEVRAQIAEMTRNRETLRSELESAVAPLRQRLGALDGRVERLGAVPRAVQEAAQASDAAVGRLQTETQAALRDWANQVEAAVRERVASLDARLDALGETVTAVTDSTSAIREALSETRAERARSEEATRRELREVVEPLRATLGAVDQRASELGERLSEVQSELGTIRSAGDAAGEAQVQLSSAVGEVREGFAERIAPLDQAIEGLTGRVSDIADVAKRLHDDVSQIDARAERRSSELEDALGQQLRTLQERFEASARQLTELTSTAEGLRETTGALAQDRGRIDRGLRAFTEAFQHQISSIAQQLSGGLSDESKRRAAADAAVLAEIRDALNGWRAELPSEIDAVVERRFSAVAQEVTGVIAPRLQDAISSLQSEFTAGRAMSRSELRESVERLVAELETVRSASETATTTAAQQLTALRGQVEALLRETAGMIEGRLRTVHDRLEAQARLGGLVEATHQAVHDARAGVSSDVESAISRLREDQGRVAGELEARLQRTAELLRAAATESAASVRNELTASLSGLAEQMSTVQGDIGDQRSTLADALGRMQRMSEMIDALSQRRGFQQLVQSERQLIQEQQAFIERLEAGRESLAGSVDRLDQRLSTFQGELDHAVRALRTETVADLERLRSGLRDSLNDLSGEFERSSQSLRDYLEQIAGPRPDIEAVSNDLQAMALSLRGEVKALSANIAGGQGTVEQRLREFAEGFRDRVAGLERRLVDTVSHELDRRFDTMIRLIEAGLPEVESLVRLVEGEGDSPQTAEPSGQG